MSSPKFEVIIEKGDGRFFARIEKGKALLTGYGGTVDKALKNLLAEIEGYKNNEGKGDKAFSKVDPKNIQFIPVYDVEAFFNEHTAIKQSAIAEKAGINASLIRQYAAGVKYPSAEQAKKIEAAVHAIAKELQQVSIYA
ncbi:MAG: helix-turn-helix transcriptional regulator [Chitinophagaceae bacterium]